MRNKKAESDRLNETHDWVSEGGVGSKSKDSGSADYAVGYRRPPKETRFTAGQSGNPRGRPKGSQTAVAVWQKLMNAKVTVTEHGRTRRISRREVMLLRIANDAMRGDPHALKLSLYVDDRYGHQAEGSDRSEEMTSEDLEILADYFQRAEPPNADPSESPKEGGGDDGESL